VNLNKEEIIKFKFLAVFHRRRVFEQIFAGIFAIEISKAMYFSSIVVLLLN
jgi:hypothetical protein